MPLTQRADGSTSAWGFACGYQDIEVIGDIRVRLYLHHTTYHVRSYDHKKVERLAWDTTSSLRVARQWYAQRVREAKAYHEKSNNSMGKM
jgi:hypothetical protein